MIVGRYDVVVAEILFNISVHPAGDRCQFHVEAGRNLADNQHQAGACQGADDADQGQIHIRDEHQHQNGDQEDDSAHHIHYDGGQVVSDDFRVVYDSGQGIAGLIFEEKVHGKLVQLLIQILSHISGDRGGDADQELILFLIHIKLDKLKQNTDQTHHADCLRVDQGFP